MRQFLTKSIVQNRRMEIRMVKKFRRFMAVLCIMMLCFTTYAFAAETSTTSVEDQDLTAYVTYLSLIHI